MIIWLNGPFGGGKTAVATELLDRIPNSMLYDPEEVGFMLRKLLPEPVNDFQDLRTWRHLVAILAGQIVWEFDKNLITPMSVLNDEYALAIFNGIRLARIAMHHVVLSVDVETLTQQILADTTVVGSAREFRLAKIADYRRAIAGWLSGADQVIDTRDRTPGQVADEIAEPVLASGRFR